MGLLQKIAISPKIRNFVQLMQARVSALKFGRYQFIKFILCLAQTFVCNHQKISVRDLFIALKLVSYSHSVCVCLTKFQKKNFFSIFSIWTEKMFLCSSRVFVSIVGQPILARLLHNSRQWLQTKKKLFLCNTSSLWISI